MKNAAIVTHHPVGPSSLGRVRDCPPSASESRKHIVRDQAEWAAEGTMLHRELELHLLDGKWSASLDEEQIGMLDACRSFYLDRVADWGVEYPEDLAQEALLPITLAGRKIERYGTLDVLARFGEAALLIDWKFGYLPLPREHVALQLMAYALMALQLDSRLGRIEGWAFMPRLDEAYFVTVTQDAKEAEVWGDAQHAPEVEATIVSIWRDAHDATKPYSPSLEACRYCKAIAGCPALSSQSWDLMVRAPHIPHDPDAVDVLYEKIQAAEKFLEGLKPDVKRRIRDGCSKKYWAAPRNGKRFVANPKALYQRVKKAADAKLEPAEGEDEPPASTLDVDGFLALGSWGLDGVRKWAGLKPKEFYEAAGDAVGQGDNYSAIARRKETE